MLRTNRKHYGKKAINGLKISKIAFMSLLIKEL